MEVAGSTPPGDIDPIKNWCRPMLKAPDGQGDCVLEVGGALDGKQHRQGIGRTRSETGWLRRHAPLRDKAGCIDQCRRLLITQLQGQSQPQHHVETRSRPSGFKKAQVARGHIGIEEKRHLRQIAFPARADQSFAEWLHTSNAAQPPVALGR